VTILDFLRNAQAQPFLGAGRNKAGRTPCCIVYHDGSNAANSLVNATPGLSHQSSGSWVTVSYTDEDWDSDGMASPVGSTITITHNGIYIPIAGAGWAGNGTGTRGLRFTHNGTTDVIARALVPGHGDGVNVCLTGRPVRLDSGAVLRLQAFQNSTGNLSLTSTSIDSPWWGVVLVGSV
jgi:hypothetical protein